MPRKWSKTSNASPFRSGLPAATRAPAINKLKPFGSFPLATRLISTQTHPLKIACAET